jgi:hypothetical protein
MNYLKKISTITILSTTVLGFIPIVHAMEQDDNKTRHQIKTLPFTDIKVEPVNDRMVVFISIKEAENDNFHTVTSFDKANQLINQLIEAYAALPVDENKIKFPSIKLGERNGAIIFKEKLNDTLFRYLPSEQVTKILNTMFNAYKEAFLESEEPEAIKKRLETERLETERKEALRIEAERNEAQRIEAERNEAQRIEAERNEAQRIEAERNEALRIEAERNEAQRNEAQRIEAERNEALRIEAERNEALRIEAALEFEKEKARLEAALVEQANQTLKQQQAQEINALKARLAMQEITAAQEKFKLEQETLTLQKEAAAKAEALKKQQAAAKAEALKKQQEATAKAEKERTHQVQAKLTNTLGKPAAKAITGGRDDARIERNVLRTFGIKDKKDKKHKNKAKK